MLRSLFAGISGLRANQTMLDVTGNNIANANTVGFKSSTTVFQDTLSQMLTGAAGADTARGGTNPIQVGLGVQLAAHHHQLQPGLGPDHRPRDRPDDPGRRHFVVRKNGNEQLYTRAGVVHLRRDRHPGHARPATGCRATRSTPPATPTGGLVDVTLDSPTRPRRCPPASS